MLNYRNVPAFKPNERAACEAMIAETQKRLASASGGDIGKIVATLALACRHARDHDDDPHAARSTRQAATELMVRYLIGYPLDILRTAADEWIKTQVFFPAVAEFRALCEPEFKRRQNAIAVMQRALDESDRKAKDADAEARRRADLADPEKRAAIDRRLAEARALLASKSPRRAAATKPRYVELSDADRDAALANVAAGKVGR